MRTEKTKKQSAKSRGLATVDALLGKSPAETPVEVDVKPGRAGADATPPPATAASRFERSIARAERGEAGPIRLADLSLDAELVKRARASGAVETYKQILVKNPTAQPGRPLVNIRGTGDHDLGFDLLTLYELVVAAQDIGRDVVQVSLVYLSDKEAKDLVAASQAAPAQEPAPVKEKLSPRDIAAVNGFLEIAIADIVTSENLRKEIDTESPDFLNLVESIRTIGLQNPPVVEVRQSLSSNGAQGFVCASGHRRLLAMQKLGMERVTCGLKLFKTEKHRTLATLAENINRLDLHFLDKADGYGSLLDQGMSAGEIASLLDSDPRTISKYLRAAKWDDSVKKRVRELGALTPTRFLLNYLAAGERTTAELHALIDSFTATKSPGEGRRSKRQELVKKLDEFFALTECSASERAVVEKAIKYLGLIR